MWKRGIYRGSRALFGTALAGAWLWSAAALAQGADESSTDADSSEADAAEGGSTAEEKEAVQASPDVQAQVGLGTEKEDVQRDAPPPESPADETDAPIKDEVDDLGHFFQFGARAGISIPYKVMARFDDSPPCNKDVDPEETGKVCGFTSTAALDLALSFAPLDAIEPYLWLRLGLGDEERTNTAALSVFGAGLRIYTMSDSMVKLYFEPAVAMETEGAVDPDLFPDLDYGTDFLVHLNFGGQIDFVRYAGIYLAVGPNVSFVRAITTTLEANAGLQVRLP